MDANKIVRVLYFFILLVVINIGATGYLIYSLYSPSSNLNVIRITKVQADDVASMFVHSYNTKDYAEIHNMLAPITKEEFDLNALSNVFEVIHKNIGTIKSFEYIGAYRAKEQGSTYFTMFYRVTLNKSNSSVAEMKISILSQDNNGIVGFNLHELEQ